MLVPGPPMSWVTTIAPALIIGLSGRPVSSSSEISLKASPDGSIPTARSTVSSPRSSRATAYAKGLEIDWMVNSCASSPAL